MGLVYVTIYKYYLKRVHKYVVKFSEQLHLYMCAHRERIVVKSHDIVPMYQQNRMVLYGHFVYVYLHCEFPQKQLCCYTPELS